MSLTDAELRRAMVETLQWYRAWLPSASEETRLEWAARLLAFAEECWNEKHKREAV